MGAIMKFINSKVKINGKTIYDVGGKLQSMWSWVERFEIDTDEARKELGKIKKTIAKLEKMLDEIEQKSK